MIRDDINTFWFKAEACSVKQQWDQLNMSPRLNFPVALVRPKRVESHATESAPQRAPQHIGFSGTVHHVERATTSVKQLRCAFSLHDLGDSVIVLLLQTCCHISIYVRCIAISEAH